MTTAADRHLLFGLLALQNGLINQAQLVAAFQAWTLDKARALADHLLALGHLNDAQRAVVEAMADLHVAKHGDVERSLAAIPAGRSTQKSLAQLGDPDIEGTLAQVRSPATDQDGEADADADRTATYSVGSATSDGLRFRVLRPHARGGLGAVFVALDNELHREVALKQILDSHADHPVSRQRFLLEAEVTGALEHPGIVPVYGLGTYDDGRPYYAMRFIRGDSLKEAIDRFHKDEGLKSDPGRRSLELRKLLRRFTDVCNAIEYAHSRGVLHRDIKPGNIIVGKHGETLVVDWGLAKATGRTDPGVDAGERVLIPSSASGSADTLPGSALGTPAYMSPEQAEGDIEHLGPRSDIYSLGATLYYLLTGRPPQEGDLGEVLRAVQRGEVTPPRRHDATIDPALESVCLKAMAHKPADRYPSPKALAEDIERWMADEPVTAYPEPWTRTLVRWLTRHRTGVTGVAAAVLAGVVGLSAVLAVQTRANAQLSASLTRETSANAKLVDEQAKVQARFELARKAIATFHTGVSEDALLRNDELKALRTSLLKQAAGFYSELRGLIEAQTDAESRRLLADGYFQLGELTAKIGETPEALRVHRLALAVRRELAAAELTTAARLDVARSLGAVGELLRVTGDGPGSLAAIREQRELAAAVLAESPSDEARDVLADGHRALGAALWPDAESVPTFQAAVALWQALADSHPRVTRYRRDLGLSLSRLGGMLDARGDRVAARAAQEQAVRIQQELADAHPADAGLQDDLTHTLNRTAILLHKMGEASEEVALLERALAIRQRLLRAYPAVSTFQGNLARSHRLLAGSLGHAGRTSEEVDHYEQARVLLKKLAADNPVVTNYRFELAWVHNQLGQLYARLGRFAEAFAALDEGLSLRQKLATSEPGNALYANHVGFSYAYRGKAHLRAGHASEAAADLGRAVGLWEKEKAPNTETRFEQARARALLAGLAGNAKSGVTKDQARTFADQSVADLADAVKAGWAIPSELKEPDFAALRGRADFQKLVAEVDAKAGPKAKPKD